MPEQIKGKILIIEDEEDIRELLSFNIAREGFIPLVAVNGETGINLAKTKQPDLIILDLMLPDIDGLEVCKTLNNTQSTVHIPIIMLTARAEPVDRILGLELGADDYLAKPFHLRELILRIKSILKRQLQVTGKEVISKAGVYLDTKAHEVKFEDKIISLTATEFRLLEDLMRHANQVRTREDLLSAVWGYEFEGYARTVDTHIRRLRAKIGNAADNIDTIRGLGYKFVDN